MNVFQKIIEKLLPAARWVEKPLPPEQVWGALAGANDEHPVWRAVMHLAQDRFVTHMQTAQALPPGDPKQVAALVAAWEMAGFMQECAEALAVAAQKVKEARP